MEQAGPGLAVEALRLAQCAHHRQTGDFHTLASCRVPSALAVQVPQAIVACDFFTVVTASFRVLYVFVAMEIGSRRLLHINVTAHPTAEWTLQQFRETLPGDHPYRFAIHDRDAIFSVRLEDELTGFGVRVLKTPVRCPKANAFCERLVGTIRRECLDFLIPPGEKHPGASLLSGRSIIIAASHTHHSALASRNHLNPKFQPAAIDIACRTVIASPHGPFSVDYITNTAWRRRLRNMH